MSNTTTTASTSSGTGPTSNTLSSLSLTSQSTSSSPITSSTPPPPPTTTSVQISTSVFVTTSIQTVTTGGSATVVIVPFTSTSTFFNPVSSQTDAIASTTSSAQGELKTGGGGGGGGSVPVSTVVPAVVVPVVAVALLILGGLFFWRRRKAQANEELRRKEVEEYGFNPNADAAVGGAAAGTIATDDNAAAMSEADGSGYRGWGTTTTARKASTTLGSTSVGAGAIGIARSDSGGHGQHSPNNPNGAAYSDHNSGDPLVNGSSRPISRDFEGVAALGSAPAAGSRTNTGVHRGPSNASSAYSGGQRSDTSGEGANPLGSPTWGNEYLPEEGPYGGQGGAPVIRDVSARRNTRIEQPSVMPQQARGGISQNF